MKKQKLFESKVADDVIEQMNAFCARTPKVENRTVFAQSVSSQTQKVVGIVFYEIEEKAYSITGGEE